MSLFTGKLKHLDDGIEGEGIPSIFWVVCFSIALVAMARALWMGVTQSHDFEIVLTSARAWRMGLDPYDSSAFLEAWSSTPGMHSREWLAEATLGLYPPSTYLVMLPFTFLPLPVAKVAWALLNVGAIGLMVYGMSLFCNCQGRYAARWMLRLGILLLVFYPLQTHFRVGQMALIPVALMMWALGVWWRRGVEISANIKTDWNRLTVPAVIAGGLALAIKPQLVLPLLGFAVLRGWWRPTVGVCLISGVILSASSGWMKWNGHEVFSGLTENIRLVSETEILRADPHGLFRHQFVNLHVVMYLLADDPAVGRYLVQGVVVGLGVVVSVCLCGGRRQVDPLAGLAAIACLTLMVTYHRVYDAVVLGPALAWWLSRSTRIRWMGAREACVWWFVTLGLLAFVTPGGALLVVMDGKGWIPSAWTSSLWWKFGALIHQSWVVFFLAVIFSYIVMLGCSQQDEVAPPSRASTATRKNLHK